MFNRMDKEAQFALRASPSEWLDVAGELYAACGVLWSQRSTGLVVSERPFGPSGKKPAVSRAWMLLAALAFENLLKGFLVQRDASLVAGGKIAKQLETHKLSRLALSAGIQLSAPELKLLAQLEACIPFWGRYPVPRTEASSGEEVFLGEADAVLFCRMFERLERVLCDELARGWQGPHGVTLAPGGTYERLSQAESDDLLEALRRQRGPS